MLSKLVLIYDKRKELPAKYKKLIESVGASVLIAASTEKSIEILTEYEPDLVLVSDSIDCVGTSLPDVIKKLRILYFDVKYS